MGVQGAGETVKIEVRKDQGVGLSTVHSKTCDGGAKGRSRGDMTGQIGHEGHGRRRRRRGSHVAVW